MLVSRLQISVGPFIFAARYLERAMLGSQYLPDFLSLCDVGVPFHRLPDAVWQEGGCLFFRCQASAPTACSLRRAHSLSTDLEARLLFWTQHDWRRRWLPPGLPPLPVALSTRARSPGAVETDFRN